MESENLNKPLFSIKNYNIKVITYMSILVGLFVMVSMFFVKRFNYYQFFIASGFFIAGIFLIFKKINVHFYDDRICTDNINMLWEYSSAKREVKSANLAICDIKRARLFEYFSFDDMKEHKRNKFQDILYFICYGIGIPFYYILFWLGLIKNVKFNTLLLTNHDNTEYIVLPLNLMSDSDKEFVEKYIDEKIGFENIKREKFYLGINHE